MPIKAVLFDVIGTTVLEEGDVVNECFRNAFAAFGIAVEDETLSRNRGRNKKDAIGSILTAYPGLHDLEEKIFLQFKHELSNNLHRFRENSDLAPVLEFLKSNAIYVGVGTGLSSDIFHDIFTHLQWDRHNFDYIGIADVIGKGRPHPGMINDMRKKLSVTQKEFLKIGDTIADIEEGRNANVMTVSFLSGTVQSALLHNAKPDFAIANLSDLKEIVLSF